MTSLFVAIVPRNLSAFGLDGSNLCFSPSRSIVLETRLAVDPECRKVFSK
jgi:hypothetical protein